MANSAANLLVGTVFCLMVGAMTAPQWLNTTQDTDDKCGILMGREICRDGFYEDYAYTCAECNQWETAQGIKDTCRFNGDEICGNLDVDFTTKCDTSKTTCTAECREHLNLVRRRQGCCVNVFNTTAQKFKDKERMALYDYALWSLCKVDLVSEQCPPSHFKLPTNADPTCATMKELTRRLYSRVQCKRETIQRIRAKAKSLNCKDILGMYTDPAICGVDKEGQYCTNGPAARLTESPISAKCPDTSICNQDCVKALQHYTEDYGCCFINQFNGTADGAPPDWMNNHFWKVCDLESPGFCPQKFT